MAVMMSGTALLIAGIGLAVEFFVSRRHERLLRGDGAVEPRTDVFRLLAVALPLAFVAMAVEGALGAGAAPRMLVVGLLLFTLSKAMKVWAIACLGSRWCFKVLVPPGASRVEGGPYRFMRHPTYVALLGELLGFSFAVGAPRTGAAGVLVVGVLIARRVVLEERALAEADTEAAAIGQTPS